MAFRRIFISRGKTSPLSSSFFFIQQPNCCSFQQSFLGKRNFSTSSFEEREGGVLQSQQEDGEEKKNLVGLNFSQLNALVESLNWKPYRSKQLREWIYRKMVKNFSEMTNFSYSERELLNERFRLDYGTILYDTLAEDGVRKWLTQFGKKRDEVESVYIPEDSRGTLCVSSQIGCTLNCKFCNTGNQKVVRNLKASEIVSQVLNARRLMFDYEASSGRRMVSNIVFMGQGEPLYNYREVDQTLSILSDPAGMAISKRKIVVSTVGVVPNMYKLMEDWPQVQLAVSLHAVTDQLRSSIMPAANERWKIGEIMEACKSHPSLRPTFRITFEYVMLKGVNDSLDDAKELVNLIKGFPSMVNLIPFNPWPGSFFETSSKSQIQRFADFLESKGISAPVRWPRGGDILAACGQLRSNVLEKEEERQHI